MLSDNPPKQFQINISDKVTFDLGLKDNNNMFSIPSLRFV